MKIHFFASLILFCVFATAHAQKLAGVRVETSNLTVDQPAQITVHFTEPENFITCGLLINFGDGGSEHIRVEKNQLPLQLTHTYKQAGNFPITVEGKTQFRGFKTAGACTGSTLTTIANIQPADYDAMAAAEQAAKKAAFMKATAERQAAENAAKQAATDRRAAESASKKAISERHAAEKTAAVAASARAAAEREAARNRAAQWAAEKANADRLAAERAASAKNNSPPSRAAPAEAEPPKKTAPAKARSAMDL